MRPTIRALVATVTWLAAAAAMAEPLRVVASVPDLGDLVREVGGGEVEVSVLTKGPQDPHFVEPRPSFIRELHDADLYVEIGMELEVGWAPTLLRSARNPEILPGSRGYLAAATAIQPLQVPMGVVTRAMGDVHIQGNPHFMTDPLNGLRVSVLIRDKLAELRPGAADGFSDRQRAFGSRLMERLVGPELAATRDPDELARLLETGGLDEAKLGGWLGAARPLQGVGVVEDHAAWIYFTRRFGLEVVATLEPKPGIAPTTGHLGEVVEAVKARQARVILASPYFDPRHASWVAERTGARIAPMAHQEGSRAGADDYLDTIDYNVRAVLNAVAGKAAPS
jgi:ABC-type Zn uptake system ZnuABC Zn-binding protein ZnuA